MPAAGATYFFRVFADEQGDHGDRASVVVDEGKHLPDEERLALTRALATTETAFINDVMSADISIMHYQGEIDFAGTVALAASSLLGQLQGKAVTHMTARSKPLTTWQDRDITWVQAALTTLPPWYLRQLDSVRAVEGLSAQAMTTAGPTLVWAWIDQASGHIRARTFASSWGIPEAQANGSGAMLLAAQLHLPVEVRHGQGSVIYARPVDSRHAALGGRVVSSSRTT